MAKRGRPRKTKIDVTKLREKINESNLKESKPVMAATHRAMVLVASPYIGVNGGIII